MYARLSKKGQVTIPKPIREKLNLDKDGGVLFLMEGDEIKLKGIPGVEIDKLAGSLKKYAKSYVSLEKARTKIKRKIADAAAREGLSD